MDKMDGSSIENHVQSMIEYHCPRWDELPEIDLYMDQVISVIEKYFSTFADMEQDKMITPTMINNYVKQKMLKPPVKKKYDRAHIAYLYIVCILKKFMSLSEIHGGMKRVLETFTIENAYNLFCDEFEEAIHKAYTGQYISIPSDEKEKALTIIRAVTTAFANLSYARYLIAKVSKETEEE